MKAKPEDIMITDYVETGKFFVQIFFMNFYRKKFFVEFDIKKIYRDCFFSRKVFFFKISRVSGHKKKVRQENRKIYKSRE